MAAKGTELLTNTAEKMCNLVIYRTHTAMVIANCNVFVSAYYYESSYLNSRFLFCLFNGVISGRPSVSLSLKYLGKKTCLKTSFTSRIFYIWRIQI